MKRGGGGVKRGGGEKGVGEPDETEDWAAACRDEFNDAAAAASLDSARARWGLATA